MFSKDNFIERLNQLIDQTKVTQKEVAEAIGISRPAISQFTNGFNLPSIDKLVALADYFNVSLDNLVGREEQKPEWDDVLKLCKDIFDGHISITELYNMDMPKDRLKYFLGIYDIAIQRGKNETK
jgi:transcriptional regulator with XRE-family HTH domain